MREPRICQTCGSPYITTSPSQKYCHTCRNAVLERRRTGHHGGKRSGAGRPKGSLNKTGRIIIHLTPEELEALQKLAGRGFSPEAYATALLRQIIQNA